MATISTCARECAALFDAWLDLAASDPVLCVKVEDYLFRFRLWANNNAAFSEDRDSMDKRLRKASLPHSVILDLLEDLSSVIKGIVSLGDITVADHKDYKDPNTILDQLFRFSRAIRLSSAPRRLMKVSGLVEHDKHGNNLTAKFRDCVTQYLATQTINDDLKDRLLETICIRQRNFASLRLSRESRMQGHQFNPKHGHLTPHTRRPAGSSYSVKSAITTQNIKSTAVSEARMPKGRGVAASATTLASNYMPVVAEIKPDNEVEDFALLDLPPRPKISVGKREQECPYCFIVCPVAEFAEILWPQHILRDLMPFVCVLDECQFPYTLYDSEAAWLSHMKRDHSRQGWICMDRNHGVPVQFTDKDSFKNHICRDHEDGLDESELDEIAGECYGPLVTDFLIDECPFCQIDPSEFDQSNIEHHVAEHLLSFAQISLSGHELIEGFEFDLESLDSSNSDRRGTKDGDVDSGGPQLRALSQDDSTGTDEELNQSVQEPLSKDILEPDSMSDAFDLPTISTKTKQSFATPSSDKVLQHFALQQQNIPGVNKDISLQEPLEIALSNISGPSDAATKIYPDLMAEIIAEVQTSAMEEIKNKSHPPNHSVVSQDESVRKKRRNLRNEIRARMVLPHEPFARFVPEDALNELIDVQNINAALQRHRETLEVDITKLIAFVCHKAKRLFAILAWSEAEDRIEDFYKINFGDEHFPVSYVINDDDEGTIDVFSWSSSSPRKIDPHPFHHPHWSDRALDYFLDHDQWPFLPPIFNENKFKYVFPKDIHLPFIDRSARAVKETYFSSVGQWRIHRAHLQVTNLVGLSEDLTEHPSVAVKQIKRMALSDDEFNDTIAAEIAALEMARQLNHPHLIRAIAYYSKGDSHYVMFPWAQGNLRDFWQNDPPQLGPAYLKAMFQQLCGLADAITTLHYASDRPTRHGDLKPENILCFGGTSKSGHLESDPCIFVIADVGLSKTHRVLTENRKSATRTKSGTIMYEPPETELHPEKPISRRYDVWSLGCIYLEFLIWLLYGAREFGRFGHQLSDLGDKPRFYSFGRTLERPTSSAELSPVVQKWIDWIRRDRRISPRTAVGELLDLVDTRLLICGLDGRTQNLDTTPGSGYGLFDKRMLLDAFGRATSKEMCEEINRIFQNASDGTLPWMNFDGLRHRGPIEAYADPDLFPQTKELRASTAASTKEEASDPQPLSGG